MRKVLFLFIILSFTSCYKFKSERLMDVKKGMHFKDVEKVMGVQLKINEINLKDFLVGENYKAEDGTIQTMWLTFSRKDSILIDMYSI